MGNVLAGIIVTLGVLIAVVVAIVLLAVIGVLVYAAGCAVLAT